MAKELIFLIRMRVPASKALLGIQEETEKIATAKVQAKITKPVYINPSRWKFS